MASDDAGTLISDPEYILPALHPVNIRREGFIFMGLQQNLWVNSGSGSWPRV